MDTSEFFYIFSNSNLQIYMTVLKFIKTIPPPPWATVVAGKLSWRTATETNSRTPRWLVRNRRGPRQLEGIQGGLGPPRHIAPTAVAHGG
jgi:hypothetical protein